MEVHGAFRLPGGAGSKTQQRDVIPARFHGLELHRLVQGHTVQLGVMVGCAVKAHNLLQKTVILGAGDQFGHQTDIAQGQLDLSLVDNLGQFRSSQHGHGVDDHRPRLGRGQPAGDHCRVVR